MLLIRVDRPVSKYLAEVIDEVLELFMELGAR